MVQGTGKQEQKGLCAKNLIKIKNLIFKVYDPIDMLFLEAKGYAF